jgi:hypothetical protein
MYDYPIAVSLTVAYTGLTGRVGYRLAGTQPQAFSTVHVAETTVSGNYEYADGVRPPGLGPLPDEFAGTISCVIRAFLADDYDAGRRTAVHVKGETTTNVAGRWVNPLLLDPGDYVLLVARQGAFSPAVVRLTVQPE